VRLYTSQLILNRNQTGHQVTPNDYLIKFEDIASRVCSALTSMTEFIAILAWCGNRPVAALVLCDQEKGLDKNVRSARTITQKLRSVHSWI